MDSARRKNLHGLQIPFLPLTTHPLHRLTLRLDEDDKTTRRRDMAGRGRKQAWSLGLRIFSRVLLAAVLPTAAAGQTAQQHSRLQGTWTLNEDLTARLRESDQQQHTPRERTG